MIGDESAACTYINEKGSGNMLKKSYLGFWIWTIVYTVSVMCMSYLPIHNTDILIRIIFNYTNLAITVLTIIMFINEKIFWYNGISYEEAVDAGSDRRKAYALKHVKVFGSATLIYLIISLITGLLNISFWADTLIYTLIILIAAVSTMRFKL
ncbi:MAG: hypothetical protein IJ224_04275 [Lachnospiraceae bacterium]|nr:hypothetical protein [Lachnospiraceae bacterium]